MQRPIDSQSLQTMLVLDLWMHEFQMSTRRVKLKSFEKCELVHAIWNLTSAQVIAKR